jgi:hypothetical protein
MSMKKFSPRTDRYRATSKIVKCQFCDFTCYARGMSNHVAKVHHLTKVKDTVVARNNISSIPPAQLKSPDKIVIAKRETQVRETVYAPCCETCKREIKKSAWEYHQKKKNDTAFIPAGEFICDDCISLAKYRMGNYIEEGLAKFERVNYDRVIAGSREWIARSIAKEKERETSR